LNKHLSLLASSYYSKNEELYNLALY